MPLARIVTSTPEQVASLAQYLHSRGYTVELVDPGTFRDASADLELDLQGCSSEEAMSRGMEAAEGADSRRATAYDITGRPVEFADEQDAPAAGGNAVAQAWQGLRSAGRQVLDDLSFEAGSLREWLAEGRRSIEEYQARHQERRRQAAARAEKNQRAREAQWQAREPERSRRQQEESARRAERAAVQERLREQQERTRRARREAPRPEPRRRPRDGDWKKAAVVAIALALLATLGYAAYENRQPAAPLSNRDLVRSQNVSQPVPFGTAIVPPPQASTIQGAATVPPPQAKTAPSGKDARQGVSLPQSDVAAAPSSAPTGAVRKRAPRRDSSYEDDPIAEDEVIIHRSASRATQARTNTRTEPKRISDLEQ